MDKDGTKMACPHCRTIGPCKALPIRSEDLPNGSAYESSQSPAVVDYLFLKMFLRKRLCLTCENEFMTSELSLHEIEKLVTFRLKVGQAVTESNETQ